MSKNKESKPILSNKKAIIGDNLVTTLLWILFSIGAGIGLIRLVKFLTH